MREKHSDTNGALTLQRTKSPADGKKAAQIMLEEENPRVRKAVFDHEERKDQAFERTGQKKIHEYNNELNSVLTGE